MEISTVSPRYLWETEVNYIQEFLIEKANYDKHIRRLTNLSEDHFNCDPDEIDMESVNKIRRLNRHLNRIGPK